MTTSWVKSLHCKSNAVDDVATPLLFPLTSCSKAKDIALVFPTNSSARKPKADANSRSSPPTTHFSSFPSLTQLEPDNSSRKVIEIIFTSSWADGRVTEFSGEIETVFRVHNSTRTVRRFEEYRALARARSGDARCGADGNEMLRFHCSSNGAVVWPAVGNGEGIRTFAGSRSAHDASGGGRGRRTMVVCRVIAGRVEDELVSRTAGELVVYDSRAVLPCFLIVYSV